jgi:hypothetical protein
MLLRRSLACREGGGAPVAYGIHISGNATYQDLAKRFSTIKDCDRRSCCRQHDWFIVRNHQRVFVMRGR